jgi:CHAD domain-containing protein
MPQPSNPRQFVLTHLQQLQSSWSGIHDADVASVHDARVAIRRIRAALPFVFDAPEAAAKELRRIGRVLGRVRELDATDALLISLEQRAPETADAVAALRREVTHRLQRQRRRMIKVLDHDPRPLLRAVERGSRIARVSSIWRNWRHELRDGIKLRASDVRQAIVRATAVYMPNRSHAARITIKKLRYTAEFAAAAGLLRTADVLDEFRKAQNRLGVLHDLHVLSVALDKSRGRDNTAAQWLALASVIAAERARVHDKYVRNRARVIAACDACVNQMDARSEDTPALAAVAIIAVPMLTAWYFGGSNEGQSVHAPDDERIPGLPASDVA